MTDNPNSRHIALSLCRLTGDESLSYLKKSPKQLVKLLIKFEVTHFKETVDMTIEKTASIYLAMQLLLKRQLNTFQFHQ